MKAAITQLKNVILIHNQTIISEGLLALLRSFGKYNVIVVNSSEEDTALSLPIGIQGYVTHQSPTETLQIAIDRIFNKDTYYCQHLISQLQDQNTEKKGRLRDKIITTVKISKREKEIIRLIRRGMPSKDIGETLGISVRTVGKHRENIMRKCNVGNVTELIYFIEKNEIIL